MNCPDPETLAQWLEGRLPEFGREALLEHLSGCDACRELSLVLAPVRRESEKRIPLPRKGFQWGPWVAAASVLVGSLIVWKSFSAVKRPDQPTNVTQVFKPETPHEPVVKPTPEPAIRLPIDPVKPDPIRLPPDDPTKPPDPGPDPLPPVVPDPEPVPPVDPGPVPMDPRPPTKALASVRVLDVQGKLLLDGVAATEGAMSGQLMTSPEGAGFHVDGHLVLFGRGAAASISREGETYVIELKKGEVFVETRGKVAFRVGSKETVVEGRGAVTVEGVVPLKGNVFERFARLLPKQRTLFFEGEIIAAKAQGGPIVGAQIALPAPADWSSKLVLRVRVKTKAPTVQVGLLFRDRMTPWAAMTSVDAKDWKEITLRSSDFSAGPTGATAPKFGDDILRITFAINTSEPGADGASLDIDDIALIEEE